MSEYATRDRGYAAAHAASWGRADKLDVRSAGDLAEDAVLQCVREADLASCALRAIAEAHAANDPKAWQEAREAARRQLAVAERNADAARARQGDASADAKAKLAAAEQALDAARRNLETPSEAPAGWTAVSGEAAIMGVLAKDVRGPVGPGWDQKERDINSAFAALEPAEAKAIAARVRKPCEGDPIAKAFARMVPERRGRLLAFLDGAPRRHALDGSHAVVRPSAPQSLPPSIRSELESATGKSLAQVQLHVGDEGAKTAAAHGARAVAIGNAIHFADDQFDPDSDAGRELIAHEVAHVVQADTHGSATPMAKRDAGTEEAAEADANQFASSFRASGSAVAWTPASTVASGTPMKAPAASPQVQPAAPGMTRADWEAWRQERSARNDTAGAYLDVNAPDIETAIVGRLAAIDPPAHPAVQWTGPNLSPHVREALAGALAGRDLSRAIIELLHPADPLYIVDRHRTLTQGSAGQVVDGRAPLGQLFWRPDIGLALAVEAELRARESLARMLVRYAAQIDAKYPAPITIADLVTSHPMDRVVARLLCDARVAKPIAPARGRHRHAHKAGADPADFRDGIEFLRDWRWMGAEDPTMWNWIEVKEPRSATAEAVAATLWLSAEESRRAYAIVASPPFFRIPPTWAEQFDAATVHRPRDAGKPSERGDDNALAVAGSAYATDVAIAQAAPDRRVDRRGVPVPPNLESLQKLLEQSWRQLERVREPLKRDSLWQLILPALNWVGPHREHLLSIPDHRLVELTPVIEGQQEILFEAVGAVAELTKTLGDDPTGTVTSVLRSYAIAIGESHLVMPAKVELAKAREAKADLPLRLLEQSAHDTRNSIEEQRANETTTTLGGDSASKHVSDLEGQVVEMRARRAAGQTLDNDDALLISAELKEEGVLSRARSTFLNLHNLAELGSASTAAEIQAVAAELKLTILDRHAALKAGKLRGIDPRLKRETADATMAAATATGDAFDAFVMTSKLETRLPAWIETIESREQKLRAFQIAGTILLLVGTSMAGSFAGGLVSAAVRGTLLADAASAAVGVTWGVRAANAGGFVAGLATDAGINAGVQAWTSGGGFGSGFVDNMLANAAVRMALAPLNKAVAAWGGAGKDLANLGIWERNILRSKTILKGGAVLTAEMITGAAVDYVVHRARHGAPPDEKTAMDWAVQGASMAIGKFVGGWLHDFETRIQGLAEQGAHLRRRAANMRKLASQVESMGDKDAAMELLAQRNAALEDEAKLIHELVSKGKLSAQTAQAMAAGNATDRSAVAAASMKTMPLRLQGLQPDDASGTVWTGGMEDISIALHQAERAGLEVKVVSHDTAARQWRVRLGGEELTIIETKPTEEAVPADAVHEKRAADARKFMGEKWAALKPPTSVAEVIARRGEGESWSDQQVRDYYNARNGEIGALDAQWKQQGMSPEARAHKASELRHEMRLVGREMMSSDPQVLNLLVRDAIKYGDGGGPTFDQLVDGQHKRGKDGNAAYEGIVGGAQRTDPETNARVAKNTPPPPAFPLPPGATVHGDRVVLTAMNGESLVVFIKTKEGSAPPESHRNADGTFNVTFGRDLPPEVAAKRVTDELAKMTSTPRQRVAGLGELYGDAAVAQKQLGDLTRSVAGELHGTALVPEKLKGQERAQQKIGADYEGETSRITDLARSSIEFERPQDIEQAVQRIGERAEIVRVKDRFKNPGADGYRDVMMNVRMPNGHIVEIQLHLKAILEVKNGEGHKIYEEKRAIEAGYKQEGRGPTKAEAKAMADLDKQAKALYDAAYNAAEGKTEAP